MLSLLLSWYAVAEAVEPSYTRIPFGREVLSHCLHEVESGSHSTALADGSTRVEAPDGTVTLIPKCESEAPVFRGLPADYDGWLSYTEANITDAGKTGGFDAFTSARAASRVRPLERRVFNLFRATIDRSCP